MKIKWRPFYLLRRPVILFLIPYCLAIVITKEMGAFDRVPRDHISHLIGRPAKFVGVVAAHPDVRPKDTAFTIDIESAAGHSATGHVLVRMAKAGVDFAAPGDRLRFYGTLQALPEARIPGTFDYGAYLKTKEIAAVLYTSTRAATNMGWTRDKKFMRWGWKLHSRAQKIFQDRLGSDQAAVLSGLVLGSRPRFHPHIREMFIKSGTMHVLVASGSNVAFVMGLWFLGMRLLFKLRRPIALGSSLPVIWMYVLVVGADAPIVRAGVMATIGLIAYLCAREDRTYHALACAALAILLPTPQTLFDVGFQMSFLTVFGLIYFLSRLELFLTMQRAWLRWLIWLVGATITAQLWIFPVTRLVFKQVYPISLISNIIVVPLAAFGLTAGLLLMAFPWLGFLVDLYLRIMISLVSFFAAHSGGPIWLTPPSALWSVGFYMVCFTIVLVRQSVPARGGLVLGVLLLLVGWLPWRSKKPKTLTLAWLDTGRSITTVIRTPQGKTRVVNPNQMDRVVMPYLMTQGIHRVEEADGELIEGARLFKEGEFNILISTVIPLRTQDALLAAGVQSLDVIQARFPQHWLWREEFIEKFKPRLCIESGYTSEEKPSAPPWPNVPVLMPQKLGMEIWSAPAPSEKPNE